VQPGRLTTRPQRRPLCVLEGNNYLAEPSVIYFRNAFLSVYKHCGCDIFTVANVTEEPGHSKRRMSCRTAQSLYIGTAIV
jgi:hypothetical protein